MTLRPRWRIRFWRTSSPAICDDLELLARFASRGDQQAFSELVERHGPLVWGVCRRAIADDQLAEDAFQAVFLVLARRAKRLKLQTTLSNWLFGVASRVAKNADHRQRRRQQREGRILASRQALAACAEADRSGPEMQELVRILDEEIGQLPPQLRGPIVACYLQGKTQDEAAQELGWTVYTLRRRLKRARDLLRARMTGRGATLSAGLLAGALLGSSALAAVPVHLPALTLKVAFAASAGGLVPPAISSLTPGVLGMTGTSSLVIGSGFVATLIAVGYGVGWSMNPTAPALAEPTTPTQISTGPVTPTKFALPTQPKAEIPATQPRPTQPSTQPGSSTPGSDDADPRYATIRGQVIWPRAIPKPQVIDVRTDRPVCCKDGDLLSTELLIDPKSRGIQNVVVWLRPDHDDRTLTFPKDKIHPDQLKPKSIAHTIDQPKCQFEPRVLAARHGDTLTIRNSATINHNVNYSSDVEAFNVIIKPLGQQALKNPLEAQRTPIMVKCDLHPWMSARVRVFDHPYFAVTDAEGRFTLPRVPVGKWRIVYWHEQGYHKGRNGLLGFPVEVTGGKPKILEAVGLELPSL